MILYIQKLIDHEYFVLIYERILQQIRNERQFRYTVLDII